MTTRPTMPRASLDGVWLGSVFTPSEYRQDDFNSNFGQRTTRLVVAEGRVKKTRDVPLLFQLTN